MGEKAMRKYNRLRSRLIERGWTLRGWALENNYPPTSVYAAARGARSGAKALKIRRELTIATK